MRKQYHFQSSSRGYLAWDVDRLVELTKEFDSKQVNLNSIEELDENYWFEANNDEPTCRAIIEHARLIQSANLKYPIILSKGGRVMDGMHRVGKAVLKGLKTIQAVQFKEDPQPDFIDVDPDELPY